MNHGELIISGFRGTAFNKELEKKILVDKAAGLILFARNISTLKSLKKLTTCCQSARKSISRSPLIIAIDHEGGRVNRFGSLLTSIPSSMAIASAASEEETKKLGKLMACELLACGINLNLAPVLDINDVEENPGIGIRSFGSNARTVSKFANKLIEGMAKNGLQACPKHFPGKGSARKDAHYVLPYINKTSKKLFNHDIVPFKNTIKKGRAKCVMVSHAIYPALDKNFPASMSTKIIDKILIKKLGYTGLIITDDIEMGAIKNNYDLSYFSTRSLKAGADILLVCHSKNAFKKAKTGISKLPDSIIEKRIAKITAWKEQHLCFQKHPVNKRNLTTAARTVSEKAVEIKINRKITAKKRCLLISFTGDASAVESYSKTCMEEISTLCRKYIPGTKKIFLPLNPSSCRYKEISLSARTPIILSNNAHLHKNQEKAIQTILKKTKGNCFAFAISNPYDKKYFKKCAVSGATYSPGKYSLEKIFKFLKEQLNGYN
ncbi:MAG: beta-N-acetylhexosaminidase [Candidatus Aureabacteria bacterium]|nr:beta-N-acetylhexosaminidase [Candidatus Auribacterota bacterium]